MDPTFTLNTIVLTIIVSTLTTLAAHYFTSIAARSTVLGTQSAAFIGSTVGRVVPASLRPWVVGEIKTLTGTTGPLATASVTGVAAALMAKLPSQFPDVLKSDVVAILADYISAFDAGLVNLT